MFLLLNHAIMWNAGISSDEQLLKGSIFMCTLKSAKSGRGTCITHTSTSEMYTLASEMFAVRVRTQKVNREYLQSRSRARKNLYRLRAFLAHSLWASRKCVERRGIRSSIVAFADRFLVWICASIFITRVSWSTELDMLERRGFVAKWNRCELPRPW